MTDHFASFWFKSIVIEGEFDLSDNQNPRRYKIIITRPPEPFVQLSVMPDGEEKSMISAGTDSLIDALLHSVKRSG